MTGDGVSAPIGPVAGWAKNRDMIPTVYLPLPDPESATIRTEYKSGTKVASSWMIPQANLPGVFTITPAKGTVLSDGTHTIEVFFTPSVVGYTPVTQTFVVTVGGD